MSHHRIQRRSVEQHADNLIKQITAEVMEVLPQDLIQLDRVLQRTVEQVLDIPVPRMDEEVFEVPKMVSVRQVLRRFWK